jgi:enoyl-CoA hydratase
MDSSEVWTPCDELDTRFETIRTSRLDRLLRLTLDRPATLNAFDAKMHAELSVAISLAASDTRSDMIVLAGNGRAFSAGGDLDWQQSAADNPRLFEATVREARAIVFGILDCEKPVIARLHGPAVGFGATLALLCDAAFIARSTYISDPHVRVGMVAGDGAAVLWPALTGYMRAKRYLLTGDRIGAEDAERVGIVTAAVDDSDLDTAVYGFARQLAAQPQLAIRYSKVTINIPLRQQMTAALDVGLGYESVTNVSDDHREALAALRDRREPRFGCGRSYAQT